MTPPVGRESRRTLGALLRSVVKVLCVSDAPDYEQPWQRQGAQSQVGSGAVIETERGLRVLTNAHCVSNHAFVELRRYGRAEKCEAEVEAIGHACDLALLRVADERFFDGTTALSVGELPELGDRVHVCGYPLGGDRVSITEGIVSRIELVSYAQSNRELLAVQIDAAINDGNSGGPVISQDGRLAGVAFQALDDAESVGYMIAPEVVSHFLADVARERGEGFPAIGVLTQPLENRAHRAYLGLPSDVDGGVLVTRVVFGGAAWGLIEPGDVLLEVDGVAVAADGAVVLREGELISFHYIVSRLHVGDHMPVKLWRRGRAVYVSLTLTPPRYLVAEDRYDVRPSYFIFGGLLFVPLSRDYLKTWGNEWWQHAPSDLVALYESGVPTADQSEVVVLQKVLADRVNQGYHDLENLIVERVDGQRIHSLADLVHRVREGDMHQYLRVEFSDGVEIVLDRREVRQRHASVLSRFGVPQPHSQELGLRSAKPETTPPRITAA
ncbi:MAG: trypsin-like peptidase domain-containing protein [Myxococcota bacterium]